MTFWSSRPSHAQWPLLIALALLGQSHAAAISPKLVPGVELPLLEGKALSGDSVALPRDARGHAAVLVIGFSKAAAKVTRPWLDSCRSAAAARPAGSDVYCYDVRMVEGVPRLFRGMIERGMRNGLTVELRRKTLLIYSENDAWRERIGNDGDDKTAYIIGCDNDGRIRVTSAGGFVEMELKKILEAIEPTARTKE